MVLNVISLGAGVQSTTMALMAAEGELEPMPDCAIFADTGWEPQAVYRHLSWLCSELPYPVHIVSAGNLRYDQVTATSARSGAFASVPWFTRNADGSEGMGRRQCTAHYKLEPIRRQIRELLGRPRGPVPPGAAIMWMGISLDEIVRMKRSKVKFIENRFPLIEARVRRSDCLTWLTRHGYPEPVKSACIGCPFHSAQQWRELTPEEFADAVEVDRAIRAHGKEQYMHRARIPLDQVDLSTPEERGQLSFLDECEGMCNT